MGMKRKNRGRPFVASSTAVACAMNLLRHGFSYKLVAEETGISIPSLHRWRHRLGMWGPRMYRNGQTQDAKIVIRHLTIRLYRKKRAV